jgi:ABC-type lipopolysaccharide export system ATPase subunit
MPMPLFVRWKIIFILLDEPFAGVDPISVGDIQQIIFHLKNKGIGILITDHNYREVLDTCDHSYVLHDGVIITEGNKEQILNTPPDKLNPLRARMCPILNSANNSSKRFFWAALSIG